MKKVVKPLLDWYQENKRDLPWREDNNPYHIWISETIYERITYDFGFSPSGGR